MSDYHAANGKRLILTMAPETAFVQGGMSGYGGIWGAYLPVIDALRDSLEILQVQLYNSGSMYGIDGNIYAQGTADFIVAMTEAVLQGFNTAGGMFPGLPASKVAIALPACPAAAGGGFTDTATVSAAIDYLRGNGLQPGTYTLTQAGGYPTLRGMMTWSINWDVVNTCATTYQYAENYENIFGSSTSVLDASSPTLFKVYPNPTTDCITLRLTGSATKNTLVQIYNSLGELVLSKNVSLEQPAINMAELSRGMYLIRFQNSHTRFFKL
ncbi:MAG: T9SS type A sorting domain-containing protein [Bacteroidia bacterium]|nr:T9SS type A sorting domain-containing protein [Bacteroidia bacterium]